MRAPINVTVWGGPASRAPAVLIHGTFSWGTLAYGHQRPLAADRRLLLPDRRGFGASPDLDGGTDGGGTDDSGTDDGGEGAGGVTSDYTVDAVDVVELMANGAHLVGHSYGGTVAMLAAAARPDLVRSLTLIEPCAHTVASDDPVVAAAIDDARRFMADARRRTPEEYVDLAYPRLTRPNPAAWLLRAARTALRERPCWLADLATEPLAAAGFPKLVIVGGWETVPAGFLPGTAAVMRAVGTVVAARIGARLALVPETAHEPQRERPATVNALLAALWSVA